MQATFLNEVFKQIASLIQFFYTVMIFGGLREGFKPLFGVLLA